MDTQSTEKKRLSKSQKIVALLVALVLLAGFVFGGVYVWAFFIFKKPAFEDLKSENNLSVVWITDTQWMMSWYAARSLHSVYGQANFAVKGFEAGYFDYAIHTGDLSDDGYKNEGSMKRISSIMKRLDKAGMPYGVLAGNHDLVTNDTYTAFANDEMYKKYFGLKRYEKNAWYGGGYKDNLAHYDVIEKGGVKYLFLYMSYGLFSEDDYAWADSVLKSHPDHLALFLTHGMIWESAAECPNYVLRDNLIKDNPNVIGFAYGHYFNGDGFTEPYTEEIDLDGGRKVVEMFYNHQQDDATGKYGFTRIIEIDPISGTIYLKSYSNVNKEYSYRHEASFLR